MLSLAHVRAIMVAYRVDTSDASRERHDGDALWAKLEAAAQAFPDDQRCYPGGRELGFMTWYDETPDEDGRLPPRSASTRRGGLRVRITLSEGREVLVERCSRGIEVTIEGDTFTINVDDDSRPTDIADQLEGTGLPILRKVAPAAA